MYDQFRAEQVGSGRVPCVEKPEQFDRIPEAYKELVVHQMMAHTEGAVGRGQLPRAIFIQ